VSRPPAVADLLRSLPPALRDRQTDPRTRAALANVAAPAKPRRAPRPAAAPVVPSARVEADGAVTLRLDGLRLVSPLNGSYGHWSAKAKRRAAERRHVAAALRCVPSAPLFALLDAGRWTVTITREGRGTLDGDNLAGAAKAVRDELAAALGCGDAPSAPVAWRYEQRRARGYAVAVRVEGAK
jgi:hypothetical protein